MRERGRGQERGEKKRRREREKEREKHRSVASHTRPDGGLNLKPRHVPWLGITWHSVERHPATWATPARAQPSNFYSLYFFLWSLYFFLMVALQPPFTLTYLCLFTRCHLVKSSVLSLSTLWKVESKSLLFHSSVTAVIAVSWIFCSPVLGTGFPLPGCLDTPLGWIISSMRAALCPKSI